MNFGLDGLVSIFFVIRSLRPNFEMSFPREVSETDECPWTLFFLASYLSDPIALKSSSCIFHELIAQNYVAKP